jgi:hypothetical protein
MAAARPLQLQLLLSAADAKQVAQQNRRNQHNAKRVKQNMHLANMPEGHSTSSSPLRPLRRRAAAAAGAALKPSAALTP